MSFSYACVLVQTYEDDAEAIRATLKKTGHYQPLLDERIFERIEKAVLEIHSYEIPAIYSWKVDKISRKYDEWISKNSS